MMGNLMRLFFIYGSATIRMPLRDPWWTLHETAAEAVREAINIEVEDLIEAPAATEHGDFALPCFTLAKTLRKSPQDIAANLAATIKPRYLKVKAMGPYLNFIIDWKHLAQPLLESVKPGYGNEKAAGKTAVIDFSSPNPAHPFHMGTIRSTVLGEAISRALESQGWKVVRLCYLNDLGRQAATLLLGYLEEKPGKAVGKPDVWLGELYFKINSEVDQSSELNEQVEDILRRLERGDRQLKTAENRMIKLCMKGFQENWKALDVKFDEFVYESQFIKEGQKLAEELKKRGLAFESDGAIVLKLEPELPNTVLLRSGGSGLYIARDLPHAVWRGKEFKPALNLYVVGEDQKLHFQQLFKVLDKLGYKDLAQKSVHLGYSMVLLEGQKMSARQGRVVLWDQLLAEGMKRAEIEIAKRFPDLSDKERTKRARSIAIAAIIYFILRTGPEKQVNFSWNEALRFEGDTGPYLQYTHARAAAILRKSKIKSVKKYDATLLTDPRELAVMKLLAQYPAHLAKGARDLRPHVMAGYLHYLADAFNEFYQSVPVLRADPKLKLARLKLVECVKTVMAAGLSILAIEAPEKM
jgi:arginyl-tRNA synthetase